ncbi:MAG: type IX secretion system membrane protein PorP/SprF, partial [Bacteroidales bacterium]|nr:type IX secretion system membrane protein PorP/SprF [Bacteroidales bacterium]MDE6514867.1 type IX secretion system membrane protein PorP/SprF [Bacteroidales bacterium]
MDVRNNGHKNTGLKVLVWAMCLLGFAEVQAQDPHFSQYFAHPLYINPAFAGANE